MIPIFVSMYLAYRGIGKGETIRPMNYGKELLLSFLALIIIGIIWLVSFTIGFMAILGIGMLLVNVYIIELGSELWKLICIIAIVVGLISIAVVSLWILGAFDKKKVVKGLEKNIV